MCVQADYRRIKSADDVFDTLVSLPYNIAPYSPSRAGTLRSYRLAVPPPHISYRVVPDRRLRSPSPACRAAGRGTRRANCSASSNTAPIFSIPIRKTSPSHIGSDDVVRQYLIGFSTTDESDGTNGTVSSDLFCPVLPVSPVKREARARSSLSSRFTPRSQTQGAGRFFFLALSAQPILHRLQVRYSRREICLPSPIPICDLCALLSVSRAISML